MARDLDGTLKRISGLGYPLQSIADSAEYVKRVLLK